MKKPLIVENSITINAPAAHVWEVLTLPRYTRKYMFGCETVSDWKKDSRLEWKMTHEGHEIVAVTGSITHLESNVRLDYTTFDPNGDLPDVPENYLTVSYNLEEQHGQTVLRVSQGDFSEVGNGQQRYEEVYNNGQGWLPLLEEIKKIAEE